MTRPASMKTMRSRTCGVLVMSGGQCPGWSRGSVFMTALCTSQMQLPVCKAIIIYIPPPASHVTLPVLVSQGPTALCLTAPLCTPPATAAASSAHNAGVSEQSPCLQHPVTMCNWTSAARLTSGLCEDLYTTCPTPNYQFMFSNYLTEATTHVHPPHTRTHLLP